MKEEIIRRENPDKRKYRTTEEQLDCFTRVYEELLEGKVFEPKELRLMYRHYPDTLLMADQANIQEGLERQERRRLTYKNRDLASLLLYIVPRLLAQEDYSELLSPSGVEVHITDDFERLFSDTRGDLRRLKSRGRVYRIYKDNNGKTHLVYLIRRQTINNPKALPTDFLELMSFLTAYELVRYKAGLHIRSYKDGKTPFKDELSQLTGRNWTSKEVIDWGKSNNGIRLFVNQDFPLSSLDVSLVLENTTLYQMVKGIETKLREKGIDTIDTAIFGHDFIYPLIAGIGIFSDEDLQLLDGDNNIINPLEVLGNIIKIDKLTLEQQETVKRFAYIQFINRYKGDNENYLRLKKKLGELMMTIRVRLFEATETALGDPIDIIDFTRLDEQYINNIPDESIRDIIKRAKNRRFLFLNFSYPLGDNTYSLVGALKELLNIAYIGFFGKVGATLAWDTQNGECVGARVGRVVAPELCSSIGSPPQKFTNFLIGIDSPIIPTADSMEIILTTSGPLLQSLEDIRNLRESITSDPNIPYKEKARIRILLDMEAAYLQEAVGDFGVYPVVCYYTSDNTKIPPLNPNTEETIVTSLGPRGSFSVMIAALSVLNALI